MLSIFGEYFSIFVNVRYCVRTYLLYGTAYCMVLRTYLSPKASEGRVIISTLVARIAHHQSRYLTQQQKAQVPICFTD